MSGGRAWRRGVVARLMAGAARPAESEAEDARARERRLARMAWAMKRIDDLKRAQKAADAAWMALVAPFDDLDEDEELPELDPPPEQAALDAIFEEVDAVTEEDRWPAHLHWSV
ncbi:MAG TPA: hypothetical protein VES64_01000 [Allosphingosinicella sp.]|nr:hypothetical protein [Allosphingosinicella sp.]